MKAKELRERLAAFDDEDEVVISISAPKDYNAKNSYVGINNLYRGFQKVSNKVLLVANLPLSLSGKFCDDCHDYNMDAEATHLNLTVYNWKEKRNLCNDCYEERVRMGCIKGEK